MKSKLFFNKVIYLGTVDSTNTYLKNNNHPDRTIVYSFNQTHGRGRNQKKWIDFKGKNLAISFLLKNNLTKDNSIWLIAASSLALIKILKKLKLKNFWIKWPNDLYVKDKKISGILSESVYQEKNLIKQIIGIGLNINCTYEELSSLDNKATSLFIETKKHLELKEIFNIYLNELSIYLSMLIDNNKIKIIKKEWLKSCKIKGKKVEWSNDTVSKQGKITGIENDGTLLLKINNKIERISSGDIKLI